MDTHSTPPATVPGTRPRVMVLFGGRSGEHAISCATAAGVLRAIDRERWDPVPVGITRQGQWVVAADDPAAWEITDGRLPEVAAAMWGMFRDMPWAARAELARATVGLR